MKVKNTSANPKIFFGTRIEPGKKEEIEGISEDELPRVLEAVEKSGDDGSDQKTKESKPESEEENGGE